jgi:hypothetical protein
LIASVKLSISVRDATICPERSIGRRECSPLSLPNIVASAPTESRWIFCRAQPFFFELEIPAQLPVVNKSPMLSGIEGKHVKITARIEMYKGKPEIRINAASQLAVE